MAPTDILMASIIFIAILVECWFIYNAGGSKKLNYSRWLPVALAGEAQHITGWKVLYPYLKK